MNSSYPQAVSIAEKLRGQSSQLEEWAAEGEPHEPDSYEEYSSRGSEVFDVQMLFAEL